MRRLILFGAIALAAGPASAQAPAVDPIDLQWEAPAGCPGADRVREHARLRMTTLAPTPVTARGTVRTIDASTWVLELSLQGEAGVEQREIRAASCDALAEAAGLLVAVAADPSQSAATIDAVPVPVPTPEPADPTPAPPPEPPPEPTTTAIVQPAIATPVPATPGRRSPRRIDGAVRADVGGQFLRVLPQAAGVSFGGALVLRLLQVRVELRGRYTLAQRVHDDDDPTLGGTIDLWTLGASGCYAPRWRRLEIPLCTGVEMGAMRGRSFGTRDDGAANALFGAVPIDAGVVWSPIPRVGLYAGAGVLAVVRRPSFHLREADGSRIPLFSAGPAALRLLAGIEVRFP